MNRLWVRLSLGTSAFLAVGLLLPLVVFTFWGVNNRRTLAKERMEQGIPADLATLRSQGELLPGIPDRFLQLSLTIGVIGVATGVWISRGLSAPIAQMVEAAQTIGTGDLSFRIDIRGSQEITELAAAFNRMAEDLERAEQLRRNLVADVAHELRTPLTALAGNLRAALDQVYQLDEEEIANLYSQTQHLIRLVKDLSTLAQAEARQIPLALQNTDLRPLVQEVLSIFAPLAEEEGVTFKHHLPDELSLVSVDAARIRQVIHNLLANALRHTPEGGDITVAVSQTDDEVQIAIHDTGEGISRQYLPLIFERFFRADVSRSRETGGTGLGLSIAKAIVEAHNGRVTASSPGLGQGSVFTIFLPLEKT